ncbi:hypothetical protein SPHINGO391_310024 [Sphingomonas aurantiaca]|uniref:Uncharacterized protein n=1 Tax=Sphingomonas aurantiaca TaxID=185949 RepID=A0A5E7XZN5_9SPHN|nr:hypothetical protein SPHINGO391_310024 [Sphingomonas aurantiaca]
MRFYGFVYGLFYTILINFIQIRI